MSIDRIHWKVGDWVLVIGKGFRPIEAIDNDGVTCTVNIQNATGKGDTRKFRYDQVAFKGVAESKDWKRGDIVYLDGIHKQQIGYIRHQPFGCVDYIEWNGDWDSASGDRLTAKPLDPDLEHQRELRDIRLQYEAFQDHLSKAMSVAPAGAKRWCSDVQEMFVNEFEAQLRGELDD